MDKLKASTDVPILFLVFNRPIPTKEVFLAIKKNKPKKLYIASDGARNDKEKEIVNSIRNYLLKNVDWDCDVKTLFREKNIGAGEAVSGAIDWLFKSEESGIILEDDCLPSNSFFEFCRVNLNYYDEDQRILAITGDNFLKKTITNDSYFYSKYFHMWGWATWKDKWLLHRKILSDFEEIVFKSKLSTLGLDHKFADSIIIKNAIRAYRNDGIDAWDYQFILTGYLLNALTITPSVNLIKNIGFGSDATHTKKENILMIVDNKELIFPIQHPRNMIPNKEYDNYLFTRVFQWRPFWKRAFDFEYIKMICSRILK